MQGRAISIVLAAMVFICGVASALEFSADMVSTSRGSGSMSGKVFVASEKMRMEMAGATTITRMDKKVSWVIMPEQGMYMEQPIDIGKVAAATGRIDGEVERTLLGIETVDSRSADKYRVVYQSEGQNITIYQWIDPVSLIPLKTEAVDGSWSVEYRNLKVGAQPAALFEVPQGMVKFAMPSMPYMARATQEMPDE